MSMPDSGQYDLLDRLAEEFAARLRRGECAALEEYTDNYPELAEEIRELFRAVADVELAEGARQGEEAMARGDSPAANPPPRQIGDYRILREIGRGGMGVVYEAEQISLGRRVAPEGPAAARVRRPDAPGAVPPRGPRRRAAAPHQHRAGLRSRPARRCPLLRHAVHRGPRTRRSRLRAATAPGPRPIPLQVRNGHRGAVAPAATRAIPPRHRGLDPWRRGRGRRGVAVCSDRPARAWRLAPGADGSPTVDAGRDPRGRRADAGRDRGGEDGDGVGRVGASSDTASATVGDATGPTRAHPPAAAVPASACTTSSSAVLPGGTHLSSVEPGRHAFFRSLAQIGRQAAAGLAHAHARDRAPGHQAVEPAAGYRRRGVDHGFRPGQGGRRGAHPER